MTVKQWEALLAASKGEIAGAVHGKTIMSLFNRGLLRREPWVGTVPTIRGRNLLHERYAAKEIGTRGEAPGA